MRLRDDPPCHLTYCLNIHPGETWADNLAAIRDHALRVRQRVAPGRAFGLGLRLGNRASVELAEPTRLAEFREFLATRDLYAFTINGFPYGRFHDTAVKDDVYRPDWRTDERRDYTIRLIDILAALLPEGVAGSISTVPGAYKPWIRTDEDVERMSRRLAEAAAHAARVLARTGRDVCIALEPEPDCFVETTDEAVAFLTRSMPPAAVPVVAERLGVSADEAAAALRRHVGVCLDTAHAAVELEDPRESLLRLVEAGVRVAKVQLSAALRVSPGPEALDRLRAFVDPVYLHQVAWRDASGRVERFADLGEAIAAAERGERGGATMLVHFHVPLFWTGTEQLGSTADLLNEGFWRLLTSPAAPTEHLEIETYTFDVLPDDLRCDDVAESIQREYEWVLAQLPPTDRP